MPTNTAQKNVTKPSTAATKPPKNTTKTQTTVTKPPKNTTKKQTTATKPQKKTDNPQQAAKADNNVGMEVVPPQLYRCEGYIRAIKGLAIFITECEEKDDHWEYMGTIQKNKSTLWKASVKVLDPKKNRFILDEDRTNKDQVWVIHDLAY